MHRLPTPYFPESLLLRMYSMYESPETVEVMLAIRMVGSFFHELWSCAGN